MNESIFENQTIDINELPKIEELKFKKPHKNYLYVGLLANTIFICFLFVLLFGMWLNVPEDLHFARPLILVLFSLLLLYTFTITYFSFKWRGYALRQLDIIYQKGVIFQSKTTIPFNRVQHCEITQGPIERIFNLKSLAVFTAGGQSSDLKISGLEPDEAAQLKEYIVSATLKKVNGGEEE